MGTCTGITFIDSTTLAVYKNPRIHHHKTFVGLARRGKTSTGWFYGFKLHLIVNDRGELLDFVLTPGNVDDRKPVPRLARRLFGKLFGDKGYLSKTLRDQLWRMFKVQLITGIRANMKNTLLPLLDKLLLRRRVIVETIVDQLKNISQIEHSRYRSPVNFVVNVLCGLIAYCRKPSLNLAALASESELTFLTLTAEAQRVRRDKRKPLCVLGVSAVQVSCKWRTPARERPRGHC